MLHKGPAKPVKAWSHSAWAVYDLCPAKYKWQNIDKLSKPDSDALRRGREIHQALADYVLKGTGPMPEIAHHADLVAELAAFPADRRVVEQQWGFTSAWKQTGWFASDTWVRVVLDVAVRYDDNCLEVVDYKTGKRYGSNDDQMEIFAIGTFEKFQDAPTVTTRLAYLDTGDQEIVDWPRSDLEPLEAKWAEKVRPMFEDTEFLPRPNDKCRFCPFSRSEGGPCRYG